MFINQIKTVWIFFRKISLVLNPYDMLKLDDYLFVVFILLICILFYRLGYTYLRLKDNFMEILNRENNVEK